MRKIDTVIVHCSATPPSMDIGVAEIRQWHLDRGWRDIGYHYVIRRSGATEEGRPLEVPGAHAKGFNNESIGICLVGGGDEKFDFTWPQMITLVQLVTHLDEVFPIEKILGHRDLTNVNKACPCFDVQEFLRNQP
jgi:N-acetyl-anhydromuramyl-L-alanine amidase AmpD